MQEFERCFYSYAYRDLYQHGRSFELQETLAIGRTRLRLQCFLSSCLQEGTMDIQEINIELQGFVREKFRVPENDLDFNDSVDLFSYGYIDSFGAVELTSFIERRFSIKFTESDWVATPLNTIAEISVFVAKRQKGKI